MQINLPPICILLIIGSRNQDFFKQGSISQTSLWISENSFDNIILDSNICWINVLVRDGFFMAEVVLPRGKHKLSQAAYAAIQR